MKTTYIGKIGSYKADIIKDSPAGDRWGVYMPTRDGAGQYTYYPHANLKSARKQVESEPDFVGWETNRVPQNLK